jgi:hypothetical protein
MKGEMVPGSVRNGSALLIGLLRCGHCGRKLKVLHNGSRGVARSARCRRAKKTGSRAIGRSRGGLTTKIHALVDALGNPVELMLTPGHAHDLASAEPLLENADPDALIGDKAYDADPFVDTRTQRGLLRSFHPRLTVRPSARATLRSIANAASSSASLISSSTSALSPPVMTNSPEISLQECSGPNPFSTEHSP